MTSPAPVQHRRWSLRARLTALVLAVAALALAAVDVLLPMQLRSNLLDVKDSSLRNVIASLPQELNSDDLPEISNRSPIKGEVGFSDVRPSGIVRVLVRPLSDQNADPVFSQRPSIVDPETVVDRAGDKRYRSLASRRTDIQTKETVYIVAWVPLADVNATVGKIIFTELLITFGLLILLGATASVIIRRELRPLESMATAADDIAQGDLNRRVYPGDPGTEVGRLGFAFNGMLDGISELIAERERGEQRMRQFLADASHELRTPVAAVRGYTDLYSAGALPDEAAVNRAMERMGFEADRMGALVGDLLTLIQADAESGEQHEAVDLADVLTGVVDDAAVIDRTRIWRLAGVHTASGAVVFGDRLRLHQLFANLLANIRTHTDPGTTATVTLRLLPTEASIIVSDDGPGVDDVALPRLFDRFYRVDASRSRAKGGTGLGLSIVAAIVRSHRGRIHASHTPGGGLTTTIVLPRWFPPSASASSPASASTPSNPEREATTPDTGPATAQPTTGPQPVPAMLVKQPRPDPARRPAKTNDAAGTND